MDEIQVDVVDAEVVEGCGETFFDARKPVGFELGGEEDLGAGDAGGSEARADLAFVVVGEGGVDVAVAGAEGGGDGVLDLAGGGLPGAEAF